MDAQKRLSVCFRLDAVSPSHVHFKMFVGMIPTNERLDYEYPSRAPTGETQCLRVDEFIAWIDKYAPNMITAAYTELFDEGVFEDTLEATIDRYYDWYPGNKFNPQCYILKNVE